MAIITFAAIYIGSYEVSLKIFELSGKKKIREIDHIRTRLELGRDTYHSGVIGYDLVEELCDILSDFARIMQGYRVREYRAYAGIVVKEAKNMLFILDQIKTRTGLDVGILSNSERRFLTYKSVAAKSGFEKMTKDSAAVIDVGGGSIQITLFIHGRVVTTQHLAIGTMRLMEMLYDIEHNFLHLEPQLEELVDKELTVFISQYMHPGEKIRNVMLMGDYITEIMRKVPKAANEKNMVDARRFVDFLDKLDNKSVEEISEELNLSNEKDVLVLPSVILYGRLTQAMQAQTIWFPDVDTSDGIAYDYAYEHKIVRSPHDFEEDILSAAKNMSMRYMSYSRHINALIEMSTLIFNAMKKVHGMGRRERLLLQVAAILHDCGKYISLANSAACAYQIIHSTEIIGLSHLEREMVANVVLYHSTPMDPYEELADRMDSDSYMIVAKLAAIMKVANAMDRSHKQKFKNVKAVIKNKELVITIETVDDISLERGLLAAKATAFESIFGLKPVIREKRVYI